MNSDKKIREQFKSKLNDYQVQIPEDGWERLEESLSGGIAGAKSLNRLWQVLGYAAAIAVLIAVSILFVYNPLEDDAIVTEVLKSVDKEQSPELIASEEAASEGFPRQEIQKQPKVSARNDLTSHSYSKSRTENIIVNIEDNLIPDELLVEHKSDKVVDFDILEDDGYSAPIEEIIIFAKDQDKLLAENTSRQNGDNIILSLGGKGGLTSFHQTVNTPMTLRSASISNEAKLLDESEKMMLNTSKSIENIAEMEHDQPVSFGVTVSKAIIDDLYIETGLIYSYLHSRNKNTSAISQNHQTQSLHYLGIPLNLNYNLFSLRDLNVFASVGGMIEKDVYGKFREEGEAESIDVTKKSEVLVNEKISQRDPQLSINAGLGLSYPIYRDLKLYGKIGGAYYFDANNEFKTIYSDRKIVMDLSLGIRYEFK